MRIIKQDFKQGIVRLHVDDLEDLWYLSHLIDPGDFVKGKTTRKIKIGKGENAKVTKKTITIKIEAITISFGASGDTLRINGKVKEAPEDIPHDVHHTITLEQHSEFTLTKPAWLTYQKQKLQEATKEKTQHLICLLDREEALFALTKARGFKVLVNIKGDVQKKHTPTEIKKDFYQEIITTLITYNQRYQPTHIILASPAFYKEDLAKKTTDKELKKKLVLTTCSSVTESALNEVIKQPELKQILSASRTRTEKVLVDELLIEINKDNLASYGWKEVQQAITAGAVSKLLLTDKFIRQRKEEGTFQEIDLAMQQLDRLQGTIHIISSKQESGKTLDGLGGIAAILRYKLN